MMSDIKPTSFNPLKIFISSSWKGDLDYENKAAAKGIKDLNLIPITGDGVSNFPPITHCKRKVKEGDILIVILGKKFRSLVQNECNKALQNEIPILGFIKKYKREEDEREVGERLINFHGYLKKHITFNNFFEPEDLKKRIIYALIEIISKNFRNFQEIYKKIYNWIIDGPLELTRFSFESIKREYELDNEND